MIVWWCTLSWRLFTPIIWGVVKLHLPVDSFVECANAKQPDNTLFPDVSSFTIGYPDLETYLPLILGFFQVSNEGTLVCGRNKDHEETCFDFSHHIVVSCFIHDAKGNSLATTSKMCSTQWTRKTVSIWARGRQRKSSGSGHKMTPG